MYYKIQIDEDALPNELHARPTSSSVGQALS